MKKEKIILIVCAAYSTVNQLVIKNETVDHLVTALVCSTCTVVEAKITYDHVRLIVRAGQQAIARHADAFRNRLLKRLDQGG